MKETHFCSKYSSTIIMRIIKKADLNVARQEEIFLLIPVAESKAEVDFANISFKVVIK